MTHTDPIKALVDLGPELQKRYDSRSVMNPTGSILLTYEEAPTILAAIEALTPIASGTSVVVPVEPTEAICEKLRAVLPELFDTSDDTLREIYTDILAASPASPAPVDDGELVELLKEIARQKLTDEMDSIDQTNADYEGAYETIVNKARAALAAIKERQNEHGK